ncbi:hypothetical protein M513_11031 [Trichuris suis]|uniref:Uncharacterized protein n=1 Tax=Trichuris suis TaxID=68888 RepID=A0A085LSZ2_9BILA|nr:hypothetical protein M513_11031 [Trichuris suis]
MEQCFDIIDSPPETDKYNTLKQRILDRFSESDEKRLQTLLSGMQIGDDKPSYFLQRMRREVPKHFSQMDRIIKHLWIQQLPSTVQVCLAQTDEEDLDKLGKLADKEYDVTRPAISAVETPASLQAISDLQAQVSELSERIEVMSRRRVSRRSPSVTLGRQNRRSPSAERNPAWCYYHNRFKHRARKCTYPCSFKRWSGTKN